jgi:hypothetical protein
MAGISPFLALRVTVAEFSWSISASSCGVSNAFIFEPHFDDWIYYCTFFDDCQALLRILVTKKNFQYSDDSSCFSPPADFRERGPKYPITKKRKELSF